MLFWVAIGMTVAANVAYNLCSKTTAAIHPLAALSVTYTVALASCLVLYPLVSKTPNLLGEIKQVNWASIALGFAIVLLESGFILAFRTGWSLSQAALFSNVVVTLILIPISVFLLKDSISWANGAGMALALIGLVLMAK